MFIWSASSTGRSAKVFDGSHAGGEAGDCVREGGYEGGDLAVHKFLHLSEEGRDQ
jgi:hypothetical protein